MSINKVVYDGNTLIDLTEDTVEPSALASGYTAHDRSGATITGTYTQAQANWTEDDSSDPSYIQNKPNLTFDQLTLNAENTNSLVSAVADGNNGRGWIGVYSTDILTKNSFLVPGVFSFTRNDSLANVQGEYGYNGVNILIDSNGTASNIKLTEDECVVGTHKISHGNIFSTTITPTAADLNDFKTGGLYHRISDISQLANCPTGSSFMMEVFAPNTSLIYQRITDYNITSNTSEVYVRVYRDATSSWSAWKRLASMDTLSPVDISSYLPTGVSAVSNQGGCYYEVRNGQVHVHIAVSGLTANTNTNIASAIPSALRPSTVITGVGFAGALATEAMSKAVLNNANGTITINSTTTSARIDFSYMI